MFVGVGPEDAYLLPAPVTGRVLTEQGHAASAKELGGTSLHIVYPDADLDAAAAAGASGIFFNQGQTCTAGSRLDAHVDCFDRVVEAVSSGARKLKVGRRIAFHIRHGAVDPATPFGGLEQSGWGREHGRQAMELYSEAKSVSASTPSRLRPQMRVASREDGWEYMANRM